MKILVTGGAGFVGSSLAMEFRKCFPKAKVVVFDNLRRRGAELNLNRFKRSEIEFVHGDIRCSEDLTGLGDKFDFFIDASASSSVHDGQDGHLSYLVQTNLLGTMNCLEFARRYCGGFVFLSSSRVYSIPELLKIPLQESKGRFEIDTDKELPHGLSGSGINETFSTAEFRSLYGATKLASELLIEEYVHSFGLNAIIDRCSVIAGPGQWGTSEQGVFTLWVANHFFQKSLSYTGFGGFGKQVRDLLHPSDLFALILQQLDSVDRYRGKLYNVGGGMENSTSLKELTEICKKVTGNSVQIDPIPNTTKVDIPFFVSDSAQVRSDFSWKPERTVFQIVEDIWTWLKHERETVKDIFL